jgi:hypothetical protein
VVGFFSCSDLSLAWAARMFSSIASLACEGGAVDEAGFGVAWAAGIAGFEPRIRSSPGFGANARAVAISAAK